MAKTYRTNPHGDEPPRRSNRTAGKSHASVDLPARKKPKTTAARKTTATREDTAASPSGNSDKFIGQRKGPPEAIVPAPEAAVAVPRLPTLWEWTPPSGVDVLPVVKPYFEPIIPMPTLVGIDFAADRESGRHYEKESNKEAKMRCVWCIRTHLRKLFSIGEECGN